MDAALPWRLGADFRCTVALLADGAAKAILGAGNGGIDLLPAG